MDEVRNGIYNLYKFDPVEFITTNLTKNKDFSSLSGLTTEDTVLKSFEAFSSMYVRGVYASNSSFASNNLPKEFSIKSKIGENWSANIYYYDICRGDMSNIVECEREEVEPLVIHEEKKVQDEIIQKAYEELNKKVNVLHQESVAREKENFVDKTLQKISKVELKDDSKRYTETNLNNREFKESMDANLESNKSKLNQEFIDSKKEKFLNLFRKEDLKKTPLLPDPMMHLSFVLGFTAKNCPSVKFSSSGEYDTNPSLYTDPPNFPEKKNIFFASGTTLIKYDPVTLKQTFFSGHAKPISNFLLACKGEIIFTNQEGENSLIRIWKSESARCIKMLTTPFDLIKVMTENKNSEYFCVVGNEQNKETIIVYNIKNLDEISVQIRQCSPNDIKAAKFSPFKADTLVTCGRENIKFWTIKDKSHLRGNAIVLNHYGRGCVFLCMDFTNVMFKDEFKLEEKGKVFVGSDKGSIFQIACNSRELEAVYKIQNSAILCLSANEAFCATGSEDGYLRLWPVDFSEFLIEAKHEAGVCGVDIAYDALDILCSTLNGSIGILNVQSKQYKTVLRSPPNLIKKLFAHPSGNFLFTIEDGMSVRIWDVEHKSEAFQFLSPKDPPSALAAPHSMYFACGFESGILKVFDMEKTEILYECKSSQFSISHLIYIQNDKFLVSMSTQGNMSIHDAENNYIQSKILNIDQPAIFTDLSLSTDNLFFATIGPESNCALIWDAYTFGIKNRIPIENFFIKKLCLINKDLLAVILENCCVRFFSLSQFEGVYLSEMLNIHINEITQFFVTKNYKFLISGGEEGMLKIWDIKMIFKKIQSYQQFIGHSKGVKSILLLEGRSMIVSASENSGIYFWNFLGDITFTETEISQELRRVGDSELMKEQQMKNFMKGASKTSKSGFNKNSNKKQKNNENTTSNIRIKHMEKEYKMSNPNYNKIQNALEKNKTDEFGTVLSMLPIVEDNEEPELSYINTDYSKAQEDFNKIMEGNNKEEQNDMEIENKLLFNIKYQPERLGKYIIPNNINPNTLSLRLCLGLSVNSMKNLVYNKQGKWYAFTVDNKIIVEFLQSERKQLILCNCNDELSCLALSPDKKYLIAGVGSAKRDEFAAILPYETDTFKLKKKLNFHYKGIQRIAVSSNCKFMVSIGSKDEKSVCIWHFTNLTVIDSKSVKYQIIDVVLDRMNDFFLDFVTISLKFVTFWKIGPDMKLFVQDYKNIYDLNPDKDANEWFTAIAITPCFESIRSTYVILGTNMGNLFIMDKDTRMLIQKYRITKFSITQIFYNDNSFTCCGNGPIVFNWKFNQESISLTNAFEFFEKEKVNNLFIDADVCSMCLDDQGMQGLLTTDLGSLFFVNFEDKAAFKILSSHVNCKINHMECDINNDNLITCGGDGSLRCFTLDNFDQKYQLSRPSNVPEKALFNLAENILIIKYDTSYLRLYLFSQLKSLGLIKIPDCEISEFALIFNNKGILLTTCEEKLFIIDVQNWEPLSVLYTETVLMPLSLPKNEICHSLDSKSISSTKSYALAAYSNGLVVTLLIEKIDGKVDVKTEDSFNMIEYHISKTEDSNIKEMYNNLGNYRSDYVCQAKFSTQFDSISICFHESLQFLFIRNYSTNQTIKAIPLNYFPYSLSLSHDEKYIGVGTKEGLVLLIKRNGDSYNSGFNLDVFDKHFDAVNSLCFTYDGSKLLSSSYGEIFIWDINN